LAKHTLTKNSATLKIAQGNNPEKQKEKNQISTITDKKKKLGIPLSRPTHIYIVASQKKRGRLFGVKRLFEELMVEYFSSLMKDEYIHSKKF
jgi:hypothetical protein